MINELPENQQKKNYVDKMILCCNYQGIIKSKKQKLKKRFPDLIQDSPTSNDNKSQPNNSICKIICLILLFFISIAIIIIIIIYSNKRT